MCRIAKIILRLMTNFVITENSLTYLIPQRWESDEALGDMAEYAPVLYSNKKHPDLKDKIPRKPFFSFTCTLKIHVITLGLKFCMKFSMKC